MENTENEINWENVSIGEDVPQMVAKPIRVQTYSIDEVRKDDKKIGDKLVITAKHPDSPQPIQVSGVKYQSGDKLKTSGLWLKIGSDGKFPYKSAISELLRYYKIENIMGLVGHELQTTIDEKGYLAVKAY